MRDSWAETVTVMVDYSFIHCVTCVAVCNMKLARIWINYYNYITFVVVSLVDNINEVCPVCERMDRVKDGYT